MPIAGRTPTTGTAASGAGFSITLPASTGAGDLVILAIANAGTTGASAPSGWTKAGTYSAGTGQALSIYTTQYSAGLTLAFTNVASVAAWTCNSFFQAGTALALDGAPVAAHNTTNNTTVSTGAPTTGLQAGDYEVLAYAWTTAATLTAAANMTKDSANIANGTAISVALGHNNTTSLGASTATTAFAPTLSASSTRKTGVGLLLRTRVAPAVPTDTYGSLVYNEPSIQNYWRLDEASGLMLDYHADSDLSVTAGITRGVTTGVATSTGVQLPLSGIERMLGLGNFATPAGLQWAFETWFMLPSSVSAATMYIAGANLSTTMGWMINTDSTCTAVRILMFGGVAVPSTGWTFTRDEWHHLLVRYDGTTATLYLDGVSAASVARAANGSTVNAIGIGNLGDSPSTSWHGLLDESAYYSGAVSATLAADHYAAGLAPAGPSPKDITGSALGVAVAATTLVRTRALVAVASGLTVASGTVSKTTPAVYKDLVGSGSGAAATVATPTRRRSLLAAATGVGATTATPTRERPLIAASTGVAVTTAIPVRTRALVAAALGLTVASGTISKTGAVVYKDIAGAATGRTTNVATVTGRRRLVAAAAGLGAASATLVRRTALSAAAAGIAATTAVPSRRRALAASAGGLSTVIATPTRRRALSAAAAGAATTLGFIDKAGSLFRPLIGSSIGRAFSAAAISCRRALVAASAGQASAAGTIGKQPVTYKNLTGVTIGRATTVATPSTKRGLAAQAIGQTTVVIHVSARRALLGSASGFAATRTAEILGPPFMPGTVHGGTQLKGGVCAGTQLRGRLHAGTQPRGRLRGGVQLRGRLHGGAQPVATLHGGPSQ